MKSWTTSQEHEFALYVLMGKNVSEIDKKDKNEALQGEQVNYANIFSAEVARFCFLIQGFQNYFPAETKSK